MVYCHKSAYFEHLITLKLWSIHRELSRWLSDRGWSRYVTAQAFQFCTFICFGGNTGIYWIPLYEVLDARGLQDKGGD